MTTSIASPLQNQILAALPETVTERLLPLLEPCALPLGKVLYESREMITYTWFPLDAIVSQLYVTEDGSSAEITLIGNDGIVGIAPFLGSSSAHTRAVVQSAGKAYRLPVHAALAEFDRHGEFMTQVLCYVQILLTQIAQTAVCNRHHTLEQQLCRWLLLSLDRLPTDELAMTQELIANMLGVRREGVTTAAGKLQKLGVIKYARGHISVLDRQKLQELSCECYGAVKEEIERLACTDAVPAAGQSKESLRWQRLRR
ncbi:MAG: Crp/Fnr family transcriptional regulator [Gammaproteobacteria bacterium]